MQVQYSERDSDHGSNGVVRGGGSVANNGGGVGLGSRERLAPPSSSSESIGGDLKSTYYILSGNSLFDIEKKTGQQAICRQISQNRSSDVVVVFFLELKRGRSS